MRSASCIVAFAFLACVAACSATARFAYSGTLQSDSASVGSTYGGRVVAVLVADGQRVSRNQPLVRLDDREPRAALAAAVAQESQARAALDDLLAGPRPADVAKAAGSAAQAEAVYRKAQLSEPAQVAAALQAARAARSDAGSAHAAAVNAQRDYLRARQLYVQGAISSQAMDSARAAAQQATDAQGAATARLRNAQVALAATRAGTAAQDVTSAAQAAASAEANLTLVRQGARPEQIAQARASLSVATANVAAARVRLDETVVRAPADGVINGLDLHAGDLVAPSAAVAVVEEFGDPYVRIYIAQSDLGRIKVGDGVDVRSDAAGNRTFSGRVEMIDASAQFTPRDVETASDRAELVFGVKVRVHDPDRVLRSGTTADVALP